MHRHRSAGHTIRGPGLLPLVRLVPSLFSLFLYKASDISLVPNLRIQLKIITLILFILVKDILLNQPPPHSNPTLCNLHPLIDSFLNPSNQKTPTSNLLSP